MFQVFSPETLDRALALRQQEEERAGIIDGHVLNTMSRYFQALFAADALGLASTQPIYEETEDGEEEIVGWEPTTPEEIAFEIAEAYAMYVAELAWGGPGIPARERDGSDVSHLLESTTVNLQWALAIADKLGIDTDEVVQYYRTRAKWMPTPGTTWANVFQQARAERTRRGRRDAA